MNLTISGHHLDVTPAIREYVQNKLERITRHFDQVIDSHVILCIDNLTEKEKRQKAEINRALDSANALASTLAARTGTIDTALQNIGPGHLRIKPVMIGSPQYRA